MQLTRLILALILTFLIIPGNALAAIAFVTAGHNTAYGSTLSFDATGCDIAFLFIATDSGSDPVSAGGATYAGVSATQSVKKQGDAANHFVYIYYILSPTTGSNNWSVTGGANYYLSSTCYSGSGSYDTSASNYTAAASSPYSASITTICNNAWSVYFVRTFSGAAQTASTNATERTFEYASIKTYDSGGAITPAGAFSQSVTFSGNTDTVSVQASFCPPATPTNTNDMFG